MVFRSSCSLTPVIAARSAAGTGARCGAGSSRRRGGCAGRPPTRPAAATGRPWCQRPAAPARRRPQRPTRRRPPEALGSSGGSSGRACGRWPPWSRVPSSSGPPRLSGWPPPATSATSRARRCPTTRGTGMIQRTWPTRRRAAGDLRRRTTTRRSPRGLRTFTAPAAVPMGERCELRPRWNLIVRLMLGPAGGSEAGRPQASKAPWRHPCGSALLAGRALPSPSQQRCSCRSALARGTWRF
mmetsp:Transcript_118940/g.319151  ORF Transcript_118940/g.319151 Transcript_118940/m.319151 type:complete len:241 (-) Transcript_118940:155-877(-)